MVNKIAHKRISIAQDFSDVPSGRFPEDGQWSGERFRVEFLVPALRSASRVEVVLDGVEGFGSSFLEEAFGGLVREEGLSADAVLSQLDLIANSPGTKRYVARIRDYIQRAGKA